MHILALFFVFACLAPTLATAVNSTITIFTATSAASVTPTVQSTPSFYYGNSSSTAAIIQTSCSNYQNFQELCISYLNLGDQDFGQVQEQIMKCGCAQGASFFAAYSNCVNNLFSRNITLTEVQYYCTEILENKITVPAATSADIPGRFLGTPTGTLAVTTWPGVSGGAHISVQITFVIATLIVMMSTLM